jgi:hypothetical protein
VPTVHSCQDVSSIHEVVIKNVSVIIDELPEDHSGVVTETHEVEYEGCAAEFELTLDYMEAMPVFTANRPLKWRVPVLNEELVFPYQKGD